MTVFGHWGIGRYWIKTGGSASSVWPRGAHSGRGCPIGPQHHHIWIIRRSFVPKARRCVPNTRRVRE